MVYRVLLFTKNFIDHTFVGSIPAAAYFPILSFWYKLIANHTVQVISVVGLFLWFLQNFYDFFTPPGGRVQKSTHELPFWEKSGKCRVQVNPRDPNFGQFWSTPGTQNWPKSGSDLMGHYQASVIGMPSFLRFYNSENLKKPQKTIKTNETG